MCAMAKNKLALQPICIFLVVKIKNPLSVVVLENILHVVGADVLLEVASGVHHVINRY